MRKTILSLMLLAGCSCLGSPARAYDVSCGGPRMLDMCGLSQRQRVLPYQTAPARDTYEYNAFQRLAGLIADRMDAGFWGDLRLHLKIILR